MREPSLSKESRGSFEQRQRGEKLGGAGGTVGSEDMLYRGVEIQKRAEVEAEHLAYCVTRNLEFVQSSREVRGPTRSGTCPAVSSGPGSYSL